MSRKSLILCLAAIAVMIIGIGVAVAVLYSGVDAGDKGSRSEASVGKRAAMLSAVPSDAVLVGCFSDASRVGFLPFNDVKRPVTWSLHYIGKLISLYVFDMAGAQAEDEKVVSFLEGLKNKGLLTEFVSDSDGALVIASESENILRSSLRHIGKDVSIMDASGFADAASLVSSSDVLYLSNSHSDRLMNAMLERPYASYSRFVARVADWVVFDADLREGMTSLEGSAIYGGGKSDFMTVLAESEPSQSKVSEILPSYTLFAASLPLGDMESYVSAYQGYLDSRQSLQKAMLKERELASKAGISPEELFGKVGLREMATASMIVDGSVERINLFRVKEDVPGMQADVMCDWLYGGFAAAVFGELFSIEDESKAVRTGDWIIAGSQRAVEEYTGGRAAEYSLNAYLADAGAEDPFASGQSVFVSYLSLTESSHALERIFRPEFLKSLKAFAGDADSCPLIFRVGQARGVPEIALSLLSLEMKKTKAPEFERDTTVEIPSGPFRVKNSGTGRMNLFYQQDNLYLCLKEEDGKGIWGVPFSSAICGTAHTIDFYANGKLQILFGAGDSLYLIDRLGRFVTGFPVKLGKEILVGPDVYDFSGARKYNVMVLHKDNTIDMYNLKGQKPASWKSIAPKETIKALPERFDAGGRTLWVVRTSLQTLIYPFYGGDPLTVFEGDKRIRPDSEVRKLSDGSVEFDCYDGRKRTLKLQ